jgi:site-specific DNA-methyltransferase (adenine-specific)
MARQRLATVTSQFGSGRRESHDSRPFYERFQAPVISLDERIAPPAQIDALFRKDARTMSDSDVADHSVALVVTSPPYFAGKEYETEVSDGHVPSSYVEYLETLEEVLAVCLRKLEPGGRMAVNVANLGRKPYRSLSADVMAILQDRLGMLLRGEIIWQKAKGAGGSCAWGSFRSPQNPVLRDVTERVVVASKGRFDRAVKRAKREELGLPNRSTIDTDEFLEATLDVWEIPSERATKVGHPSPWRFRDASSSSTPTPTTW